MQSVSTLQLPPARALQSRSLASGVQQRPPWHVFPPQHSPLIEHVARCGTHAPHNPWLHTLEQHSVELLHEALCALQFWQPVPEHGAQTFPAQVPLQHWSNRVHAAPALPQAPPLLLELLVELLLEPLACPLDEEDAPSPEDVDEPPPGVPEAQAAPTITRKRQQCESIRFTFNLS